MTFSIFFLGNGAVRYNKKLIKNGVLELIPGFGFYTTVKQMKERFMKRG